MLCSFFCCCCRSLKKKTQIKKKTAITQQKDTNIMEKKQKWNGVVFVFKEKVIEGIL